MKVIFLDIDGVLNSRDYFMTCAPFSTTLLAEKIDPVAVERLNRITRATEAVIVISSTWRLGFQHNLIGLKELLRRHQIEADVIGMTPNSSGNRGAQIQSWLDDHRGEIEQFIIIDDDDDMNDLSDNLIKTTHEHGLQEEHIFPCIMKLV
jgi:hypothetical protein